MPLFGLTVWVSGRIGTQVGKIPLHQQTHQPCPLLLHKMQCTATTPCLLTLMPTHPHSLSTSYLHVICMLCSISVMYKVCSFILCSALCSGCGMDMCCAWCCEQNVPHWSFPSMQQRSQHSTIPHNNSCHPQPWPPTSSQEVWSKLYHTVIAMKCIHFELIQILFNPRPTHTTPTHHQEHPHTLTVIITKWIHFQHSPNLTCSSIMSTLKYSTWV